MNNLAKLSAAAILIALPMLAAGEVAYTIDATFDLAESTLVGTVRIALSGADLPREDIVFLSNRFGDGRRVEFGRVTANGQETTVSGGSDGAAVMLPSVPSGSLQLEIEFSLAAVPDVEGIFFFDDNVSGGRWRCWYPRLIETASLTAAYDATFRLVGPGIIAHSAPRETVEEAGPGRAYRLGDPGAASLAIAASPIFVVKRAEVAGCNLGVFAREGSDRWGELLLTSAAEIYEYYAECIPGFARSRLDVVLAAEEYPDGEKQPQMVIIHDELDEMAGRFGGVFAGSYLSWQASLGFARCFWAGKIHQPPDAIPWLREGLVLLFAEDFSDFALLGGPAFDNIRQFYLNAASAGIDTSLDRGITKVEETGLDAMQVLARGKGLWVTGMLRERLGRGGWQRFVETLAGGNGDRVLDTGAIEQIAEQAAGGSLDDFFRDWIRGDYKFDIAIDGTRRIDGGNSVRIVSRGDAVMPATVRAVFLNGEEQERTVEATAKGAWIEFKGSEGLRRVELDPERKLPDLNRGDNVRSFATAERIELLYSIDREFDIGELIFDRETLREDGRRTKQFSLSITNLTDKPQTIGLRLTSRFPGARNRGLTGLLIELSPGETKLVRDKIPFSNDGRGLAEVRAEYYPVADREAFEKLKRGDKPSLINDYIVDVPKQ